MIRLKKLALVVALSSVVAGLAATSALAQTGPITPPTQPAPGGTGPVTPVQPAASQALTPAALAQHFQGLGYQIKQQEAKADGTTAFLVGVQKNGWRFDVEIYLTKDGKSLAIGCRLGSQLSPGRATADQLMKLMEANMQLKFARYITYRANDRQLLLTDTYTIGQNGFDTANFDKYLGETLQDVMSTHPLWSFAR